MKKIRVKTGEESNLSLADRSEETGKGRKKLYVAPVIAEERDGKSRKKIPAEWLLKILAGVVCGFVNGMFGGGGGMIVVPFLKSILKYDTARAHATTIAVILPLSVLSGAFYATFGAVDILTAAYVTAGAVAGGVIGARLLKKLKAKPLTVIFSVTMLAAGIKMLAF